MHNVGVALRWWNDIREEPRAIWEPASDVRTGAISPDGKYLAYTDMRGIHIKILATGETGTVPQPAELVGQLVNWGFSLRLVVSCCSLISGSEGARRASLNNEATYYQHNCSGHRILTASARRI